MQKIIIIIFISFFGFFSFAEEGMLIPSMLAAFQDDMQAMGMKLSAEDVYSVNQASIKDAIFQFNGGCTAGVVSSKGLLLTNHHCGYSSIQSHSSLENDYLKNGFWAKSLAEELSNPGMTAMRIVRIDDVTEKVLEGTEGLTGAELNEKLKVNIARAEAAAVINTHYTALVKAFNYGNQYFLMLQETFHDIRLVGTPPNSIGKFGGDTDNWVWPRHTGDFSVFRIYTDKENMPAEYSENNVPYKPIQFLKVSVKDRIPGEFTMVYGFPGTTEQHLVGSHLEFIMNTERPARIAMRDLSLSVINSAMSSSDKIRIQYASKQARIANAWKKWIGQVEGLHAVDALSIKENREASYQKKADSKKEWKAAYGSVLNDMDALVQEYKNDEFAYSLAIEYLYVGPELFARARSLSKLEKWDLESMKNSGNLNSEIEALRSGAAGFFKNFDLGVDKQIFKLLSEAYRSYLDAELVPAVLADVDIDQLAENIYANSLLVQEDAYQEFLNNLTQESLKNFIENDPGYRFFNNVNEAFTSISLPRVSQFHAEMDHLLATYVQGIMVMCPEKKLWPDANSTLRITYGKLEGSAPHDGMAYTEHTTLNGIIAKNRTGNPDFEIDNRMIELATTKEYGKYDQDGELWVCFSGSNHTTGGNSGSPVLDGEGNLMGLNFDRSWESTMSDYMFDASRCRNITVDIRYVLWVMDVYSGAKHLVKEMKLVK